MTRLERATRRTFHSLRRRNFRLYLLGQVVSATGSWMQTVAQAWLVLQLTGSAVALGLTLALQFLPILVFGAWAGVMIDRLDKRRLLVVTAAVSGALAVVLGAIVALGIVQVWMVYGLAAALGFVTAFDNPTRRAFVTEMVARDEIANAVSLNSAVFTLARLTGPAVAGILIARVGLTWCFLLNGFSFLAVIAALLAMRVHELRPAQPVPREKGQLRAGLRYAWQNPTLRLALATVAIVSTIAFNFHLLLPLLATQTFGAGAETFGLLTSLLGLGSLLGALVSANRAHASGRQLVALTAGIGVLMLGAAAAPSLGLELVVLVPLGAAAMAFIATATTLVNEGSDPAMRGRMMALFAVAFLGSTPLGGPLVGWIAQLLGPRAGLVLGGLGALGAAAWGAWFTHRTLPGAIRAAGTTRIAPGTEAGTEARVA